jgi:multiple sugar transport system permease protein
MRFTNAATVTPETLPQSARSMSRLGRRDLTPYGLLMPAVIVLAALTLYPFLYSIYISLFNFRGGRQAEFAGLGNYIRLLSDGQFWNSLWVVLRFTILAVGLELVLGLALALFFSKEMRGRGLWRSLVIVPMMLTPVVVGVIWRLMLNPGIGVINYLLALAGLKPVEWLSNGAWAFISIVLVDVWNWTAFMFLILLAGIQAMPVEPFEAARIDGASSRQIFFDHTLPLLKGPILVAVLIRTMDAFRIFDQVFIMTQGGPGNSTEVASLYLYKTAFKFFDMGYAAAGLFVVLIIITFISRFYVRLLNRES